MTTIKLLALVEATTVNAVAKNMLEFHRAAGELRHESDFPAIEVSIATFERRHAAATPNEFVTAARASGLEVDVIPERRRFDLSVIPTLREVVNRRAPDIVLTHSVKSHFLLLRSRLWREYSWVAFHHGYTATDRKMRLYNRLDRWSLPKADRVITVCQAFAEELVSTKGVRRDRISVQHNAIRPAPAVTTEEVQSLRKHLEIESDERMVLAVGRLSKEKAHIDLLDAFDHLRKAHPEISARLVVIGDGPERESLEVTARLRGLADRVTLTGQISDVQPYYAAANVLANASHTEGSPYVLLEAMAAGLPIVATAVGGVPEMVQDNESALLVPPRDPSAMAEAIARLLNDGMLAKRLAENALDLTTARFSPGAHMRSLTDIYRTVISNAARQ